MRLRKHNIFGLLILAAAGMTVMWQIGLPLARGQAQAQPKPKMAEEVFKNIQVLKGIPLDDFMQTMGIMSASLSYCCNECHEGAGTDKVVWEADTPRKRTARRMVTMVQSINRDNFAGRQVVTCWTCHRGRDFPVVTMTLDQVYSTPNVDVDDIYNPARTQVVRGPKEPTVDQILDKYIQALGGAQRLAGVTSFVATGNSVGFGGFGGGGKVEISAKSPDQRATHMTYPEFPDRGDVWRTFNGRTAWFQTPLTVMREYQLEGNELDGARLDAMLLFPGRIKQVLTNLRVLPGDIINDRPVEVVQAKGPGANGAVVTMYFDIQTGLLNRMVRYTNSPIGRVPTQTEYSDYRDLGGIKFPYNWTFAWLDGRDNYLLSDVKLNVPIDEAKFGKPPALRGR